MPDLLTAAPYCPQLAELIRQFDFGPESYERELSDWLRDQIDSARSMGVEVWLYWNTAGDCVGFGSVGETGFKQVPPQNSRTEGNFVNIPALGLRTEFQGEPKDAPKELRYSRQIMQHLIERARRWPGELPALRLYVHPENVKAIRFYPTFGFVRTENSPLIEDGIEYPCFALKLR